MATIKDVARAAGVSTATVSAVVNDTAYVSPELRARVLAAVRDLRYAPSLVARNLRSGRSQLIALAVADLANPFYARIVTAAEAAVAAWGYSLVLFNSDEKPDIERRILSRIRTLGCDGSVVVPVGPESHYQRRDFEGMPVVLLGRSIGDAGVDTVTIDNLSAGKQATNYLLDLGHRHIGSITGPMQLTTGSGRLQGMLEAMAARGLAPKTGHVRSGEFREDTAYSVARDLLGQPDRPTALYVANGVMAIGVMRAVADLGLRCPEDVSIASTDTVAGAGGLKPRLTRTEHPVTDMTNEALRMLVDRIEGKVAQPARNVVFQPALVVGESCSPLKLPTH
ncbi:MULTISPECIES: LacI family DNA-binding transcriptional regulator [unclassified Mesorhizobium]|uniref:LacI family DNA-binding transcriptional regulator n=1 Tax=unclassified Mesorhizobium TaxID=325217 RepID=UPI001127288B|nr:MULTISPECIES: LacI family DNA-binding transcriptional regulator [unclassified Mesorhizobium]MCA0030160.1 LacI family transcriptional regulator [Mesorhizobium sp. B263B2A]TPN47448.1 LacI family transcriptional regulator [Mesorhizobium sp. B1-1-9]TPN50788.1 LacI family transcriptional regulator [Mesorhizobium sp. B1-1-7]